VCKINNIQVQTKFLNILHIQFHLVESTIKAEYEYTSLDFVLIFTNGDSSL